MTRQTSPTHDLSPATSVQRLLRSIWWDARLALAAIVVLGFVLRLVAWVHNRSFWVDEIYLALNITTRSFADLWQPLAHDQGAPVGFLMLVKFVSVIFGTSEMALRAVPLLAGLASLILFPKVAARLLPAGGVLFATALFAITPKLIYYSSELKQYSSDVLVTLLLVDLVARRFGSQSEAVPFLRLAIVGSVAIWFSHPALFVLAGLGLVLAFDAWRQCDRGQLKRLLAVGGTWLASFGACYLLCLRELGKNQYLLNYWSEYLRLCRHETSNNSDGTSEQ